jgi:hypothetical protein
LKKQRSVLYRRKSFPISPIIPHFPSVRELAMDRFWDAGFPLATPNLPGTLPRWNQTLRCPAMSSAPNSHAAAKNREPVTTATASAERGRAMWGCM